MTYSYFPGCTLKTTGTALDHCGRQAAQALGIRLEEIPDWQCCGGVYPMARDEIATRLSSVRALCAARETGGKLVTMCSACYHVLRRVNNDMRTQGDIRRKVNNYLRLEVPYGGEAEVVHYLEVLRDEIGWKALKEKVKKPLTGRKIGAYYGCLLLRPSKELGFDDPENPTIMEDFIRALGAEPITYAMRNECCGGYTTLENAGYAAKQAQKVLDDAACHGAELLITACPLCMYNLTRNTNRAVPVKYFTELLFEALGLEEDNG